MRERLFLLIHPIATIAKLLLPGGARSIIAESLLLKHQLLIMNRSRARAPNLRPIDRIIASLCAGLMRPGRLLRSAIVLKPSTLMAFHRALVNRKYRLLFAPRQRRKRKLRLFRNYYNHGRVHASLKGVTPICSTDRNVIALDDYQWRSHCRGLYQLPAAA